MIKKALIFSLLTSIFFIGCKEKQPYKQDVSEIKVKVEIKRLDQDLFEIDLDSIHEEIPRLTNKYGSFFEIYNRNVLNIGGSNSRAYPDNLQGFLTDFVINQVHEKTMEEFPQLETIEKKLTFGFKHYKYYFPDKPVPHIYTFIGGFNQSIVVDDSLLAIGLDKYLGRDCEFYDKLGWSEYLQKNMYQKKIPTDAMKAWGQTEWVYQDSIDNLLSNMLYRGKILYFVKSMFPEEPDTLITGFTAKELEWCQMNEKQIWNYLVEHKLLFETDYMTINKFVNPAPFTTGFPRHSPGRAINWLGWQIVEEYMKRNKNITLPQLMKENDYQEVLSESKYHP
jgi:gliding motility-associated lipoprotein GldB